MVHIGYTNVDAAAVAIQIGIDDSHGIRDVHPAVAISIARLQGLNVYGLSVGSRGLRGVRRNEGFGWQLTKMSFQRCVAVACQILELLHLGQLYAVLIPSGELVTLIDVGDVYKCDCIEC